MYELTHYDVRAGHIVGFPVVERRLSSLVGCFADGAAYVAALSEGDPVVYSVSSVEPADGEGDLHYGLGVIQPGRVGVEYYMTKGHLHSWRAAAEVYIALSGEGMMLLEDQSTGTIRMLPLRPQSIVYVPGYTAHRTMNIGSEPLTYIGIYPARAGHDYDVLSERNFRHVVVDGDHGPALVERAAFEMSLKTAP